MLKEMRRREFLATWAAASAARPAPPNLVLFISDDHGWRDSPVYGSRAVRTPNLERLAAAGAVFTNAFGGSPTCVPSRAIVMSGLMPARNGSEPNHVPMKAGLKTLPTYLKELGYRVAHFGKSHFVPPGNYRDWEFVPSEIKRGPLDNDLDTAVVEQWLAGREGRDPQPAALVVCSHSPHVYWPPNEGYDAARVELPPTFVDTPETRRARTCYYTDITKMDRQLGEVYDSVRRHLGANTLFLYTSDNGAQWPFAKWNLYDAGIRLPLIAVWPGVVKPGRRTGAMISFADFMPTLVEVAGGQPPADIDGRSFASVLRGRGDRHRTEAFASHSGDGNMNVYPMRAVRTERFKYILNLHPEYEYTTHIDRAGDRDGKDYWTSWVKRAETDPRAAAIVRRYHVRPAEELYEVRRDPHETANLAGRPEYRRELESLRRQVRQWMTAQGDEGKTFGVPRRLT